MKPVKPGKPVAHLKEELPMLTQHQYARIYRRVRAATMIDPRALAEFDAQRNIVYINIDIFDELPTHEQSRVYADSHWDNQ
jgi:hypothetical protein